jgi:glycosyltransferase involved in cell wall biosynthesis
MNVWLVCQYYAPERGAAQTRMSNLAKLWVQLKAAVTVITAVPHTPHGEVMPEYKNKSGFFKETLDGVPVWRHGVPHKKTNNHSYRLWGQLSFALSLLRHVVGVQNPPQVVIASTPPMFMALSAWLIAKRYNARFVMDVRALWPSVLVQIGLLDHQSWQFRLFRKMESFLYQKAHAIVANSRGIAQHLVDSGINPKKVFVLPDGVTDDCFNIRNDTSRQAKALGLRNQLQINPLTKVVLYDGPHSMAQALGQVIDAARYLMPRADILFLLIGDGDDKERLQKIARGMPNVQFISGQSDEARRLYYTMADVAISCHKDVPGIHTHIPPRLLELLAAGLPVLAPLAGEGADIVRRGACGVVVPPEDPDKLARGVVYMLENTEKVATMAANGPKHVNQHYRHSVVGRQYLALLQKVVGGL